MSDKKDKTPESDDQLPPEAQPLTAEEEEVKEKVLKALDGRKVHETTLIQFIRGYSYEEDRVAKTIEMLTKCLDWRDENKIDTICDRKLPKRELFQKTWQTVVSGKDPEGRLIICDRLGAIKPSDLLDNFTVEELQMQHVQNQEFQFKMKEEQRKKTGKRIYKAVSILDLDGIGMGHTSSKFTGPARSVTDIDQWFYPESMHKMYVVNAPWVFKMIWKVVRPWLHPITQEKIQVCGSNFLDEIMADGISKDQLPEFIGGSGTDIAAEFEANYKPEDESAGDTSEPKKKTKKKKKKKTTKDGEEVEEEEEEKEEDENDDEKTSK